MHIDCTDPVIGLWRTALGVLLLPGQSEIEQGRGAGIMSFSKWGYTAHLMQRYLYNFDGDMQMH